MDRLSMQAANDAAQFVNAVDGMALPEAAKFAALPAVVTVPQEIALGAHPASPFDQLTDSRTAISPPNRSGFTSPPTQRPAAFDYGPQNQPLGLLAVGALRRC